MLLPVLENFAHYSRLYDQNDIWFPAIRQIIRDAGLTGEPRRLTLGTHLVFAVDDVIIKLYCPLFPRDFTAEQAGLDHYRDLPVPTIIARGELEGWPWLVLSRVDGIPALEVWPRLTEEQRRDVIRQLGELIRTMHTIPPTITNEEPWSAFIAERLRRADEHHDAEEPWKSWIRTRLENFREPAAELVYLHGDLTADHLLLTETTEGWRINGLIDFGDARIGHPCYEFLAPIAFYTCGRPGLSRLLLTSAGIEPTPETMDSMTDYCLLHEFGTLQTFLDHCNATTPDEFIHALWD